MSKVQTKSPLIPKKRQTFKTNNFADLSKFLTEQSRQDETETEMQAETQAEDTPLQTPQEKKAAFNEYRNGTYAIVSKVAYLIGLEKSHFGQDGALFQEDIYSELDNNKEARIIRHLCRIRAAMERNYKAISLEFRTNLKNIGSVPDLIPTDSVETLFSDGVRLYKANPDVDEYIISLNMEISNRINSVSALFPEWLKWDYVRPIFLMPNGTKKEGIKKAGDQYNADRRRYPFQCWINWNAVSTGAENKGNILYDDEKFVRIIYERNEDRFENLSLVRDAGNHTMRNLYEHLEHGNKCAIVVDCENSDAVKLAAALSSLRTEQLCKISKVLLFDSEYTTDQWKTLVDKSLLMAVNGKSTLELEHIFVPRLHQNKSQVDMTLAVRTSREVYAGGVDSVILVSSDSDYWAMINQLEDVKFLVMLERQKTGLAIVDTLMLHEIPFCFIDDFCTAASYTIKTTTLINGIQAQVDHLMAGGPSKPFNIREMMENTLQNSWISMTEKEKEVFYKRYLLHMRMDVDEQGNVSITIG